MNKSQIAVIRGRASYAKILGDPVPNFSKDGKEWKVDLKIDKNTVKELKSLGIGDRVKSKEGYLDGEPYFTFKQRYERADGKVNDPVPVKDILGKDWDQSKLIGNDSVLDIKFSVVDYGVGKKRGVYMKSVRVLDHIPYAKNDFEEVAEDDEYYQKAMAMKAEQAEDPADDIL